MRLAELTNTRYIELVTSETWIERLRLFWKLVFWIDKRASEGSLYEGGRLDFQVPSREKTAVPYKRKESPGQACPQLTEK